METLFTGVFGLFLAVFLIVLAILWFCFPFAVFGTKPLLKEQNRLLTSLLAEVRSLRIDRNESSRSDPDELSRIIDESTPDILK